MPTKVAVVEDDPEMGEFVQVLLKSKGFEVSLYPTPGRFFDALIKTRPDLVVLDMHLPGMDGKEVIRVLRSNPETRRMFIIAMSALRRKTSDVVAAVQAGADEYFTKPVDPDLLLIRINALMRRGGDFSANHQPITFGPVAISPEERSVRLNGKELKLTRLEFDLLVYLVQHPNRVMTRGLMLDAVWGGTSDMTSRTVDKHVESLRCKLGGFGKKIQTIIRVGYMLKI